MNIPGIISIIYFSLISTFLFAQRGIEVGPWIGASNYFGDLNTEFDVSKPGLAGGLIFRYNFNPRICVKIGANYGRLRADDLDSENDFEFKRGLNFHSNIFDFSGQIELNFFPYLHGSRDKYMTPYMFAGVSTFFFNPIAEYNGQRYFLRDLGTEGQFQETYSLNSRSLIYGAGFKVDLSADWSLNLELSFRRLFMDYIDDVSTTYPDPDELTNPDAIFASNPSSFLTYPEITGKQRGNAEDNDSFTFFSVGFLYYFGSLRCPKISNAK